MKEKAIKLNLGSGPSGLDGWVNYDYGVLPLISKLPLIRRFLILLKFLPESYDLKWPKINLVDIKHRLPLKDSCVKYIYCSHVLEHFELWEVLEILKECRRVLQKNGIARIVVPDIEKMLRFYYQTKNRQGREFCRLWWGFNKDEEPKNIIQKMSRSFIRDHKWHYDRNELTLLLKEAGFKDIKLCQYRQGLTPDINKLDLTEHQNHSLYLEAKKS